MTWRVLVIFKIIPCVFERLVVLMINFNKSEVSFFGKAVERKDMYAYIYSHVELVIFLSHI